MFKNKEEEGDFPGGPVVNPALPMQGGQVRTMVGEIRSHMLCGSAKKKRNKEEETSMAYLCKLIFKKLGNEEAKDREVKLSVFLRNLNISIGLGNDNERSKFKNIRKRMLDGTIFLGLGVRQDGIR